MLSDLMGNSAFARLGLDGARHCLAKGMGFESWPLFVLQESNKIAELGDLPDRDGLLIELIAWRMYLSGEVGIREAVTALYGAWPSSKLRLRAIYGDSGDLSAYGGRRNGIVRRPDIEPGAWAKWPDVWQGPDGTVSVRAVAEMAHDVARYCWTPDCGVTLEQVEEEVMRCGTVPLGELIEESFFFTEPWPPGLTPTQYQDTDGYLLGYGWKWQELGMHHGYIFGPEEFKESAVRLWQGRSTQGLQLLSLPEHVVETSFTSPFDRRKFSRGRSAQASALLEFESGTAEAWMDLKPTDGERLRLGHQTVVEEDPWTRLDIRFDANEVGGTLGMKLPSWRTVSSRRGGEIAWLRRLVPLALDEGSYRTLCRAMWTLEGLARREAAWLESPGADRALKRLAERSCALSKPSVSAVSEVDMAEPTGVVRRVVVPEAARHVEAIYPELDGLTSFAKGEHLLAYVGRRRLGRAARATLSRDRLFLAYSILRNLGVDTWHHRVSTSWLSVFRLVRLAAQKDAAVWTDSRRAAVLATDARAINEVLNRAEGTLADLDPESSTSRLDWIDRNRA